MASKDSEVDTAALPSLWSSEVVDGHYAGHPGLLYKNSPPSIVSLLEDAGMWANRDYLVHGDRRIGHGEFRAAVPRAASILREVGVRDGDRIVLYADNGPEFVLALWAAWWVGAVPVCANRWWNAAELAHAIETTAPVLVLADDAGQQLVDVQCRSLALLGAAYDPVVDQASPAISGLDDVALILFTSGSSGRPKAVQLSNRSVIANQQNLLVRSGRLASLSRQDASQPVTLVSTPLFHIGGISNVITNLMVGGRLVMTATGRFNPAEVLELIARECVRTWGGVPTMAKRVLEHPDFENYDLSSLRSFPLGGAPVPQALLERMTAKLPQLRKRGLVNTWGMTETGGFVTVAGNADLETRPGTVGRPYEIAEIRIEKPNEEGSGEVLVRSPTVMLGYLGIDDDTVDAEGWLHTGDLGHLDEDGYLYLDGRSKDIVIRGGENIACIHVEQTLSKHPGVSEVAVFGVPHEDLGEEVAAVVVIRPHEVVDAEELRQHCRTNLSYFEIPTRWKLTEEPLPTLAGEKVDKARLRREFFSSQESAVPTA